MIEHLRAALRRFRDQKDTIRIRRYIATIIPDTATDHPSATQPDAPNPEAKEDDPC